MATLVSTPKSASQLKSDLILEHYPLARSVAMRAARRLPRGVDVDELVSVAVMGLIEAVQRYDASRGVPFRAYARHRILGAIMDSLRASDWVPRSVRRNAHTLDTARTHLRLQLSRDPSTEEMADFLHISSAEVAAIARLAEARTVVSLDAAIADDSDLALINIIPANGTPQDDAERDQMSRFIADAMDALPARERATLHLVYYRDMSLKQAGTRLGVTESRACQLRRQALRRMRPALALQVS